MVLMKTFHKQIHCVCASLCSLCPGPYDTNITAAGWHGCNKCCSCCTDHAAQRLSCPECGHSASAMSGSCTTYPKQEQKHGPWRSASGTREALLLEGTKTTACLSASSSTHLQSLLHRGVQQTVEQRDDFDCLSPHFVQQTPHLCICSWIRTWI